MAEEGLTAAADARAAADAWNRAHVPGRAVIFADLAGSRLIGTKAVTRTSAFVDDRGEAVVHVLAAGARRRVPVDLMTPYDGVDHAVEAFRASGDAVCTPCGRTLREHPPDLEHLGISGVPFLVVGCDGRAYKL